MDSSDPLLVKVAYKYNGFAPALNDIGILLTTSMRYSYRNCHDN